MQIIFHSDNLRGVVPRKDLVVSLNKLTAETRCVSEYPWKSTGMYGALGLILSEKLFGSARKSGLVLVKSFDRTGH